ncbi:MAG: nuclear transport factor 2 family protein [Pseudomonadota bacterium]|nr:nuclear transport factor 2 family protein [Pseudomonadota bacterium]
MIGACEKSTSIVQCLLKYWLKAWNECGEPGAAYSLASIFAEGDGAIDVRDDAFGSSITARSYAEYKEKWLEALDGLEMLAFEIVGEPKVEVSNDRADISFELIMRAEQEDGRPINPPPRWRGEHEWRRMDGEWRIVRERLKAA